MGIIQLAIVNMSLALCGTNDSKSIIFDLDKPGLIEQTLLDLTKNERQAELVVASISDVTFIDIAKKGRTVRFASDLTLLTEPIKGNLYLDLKSEPMSREDAAKLASILCEVVALNKERLSAWTKDEAEDGALEPLEIRRHKGDVSVSLEIRHSLRQDLPWRIYISFGFNRTR